MGELQDKRLEEVLKRISESPQVEKPLIYHPSENVNADPKLPLKKLDEKEIKFFDNINSYHVYCILCHHHYYSSSKLNDINSFFQRHINSVNHLWNQQNSVWDMTKPIFTWEKWLCTGFCEICKESGIESFIIDTNHRISDIKKWHSMKNGHLVKKRYIEKQPMDLILAKSDLFSKLYIDKKLDDTYVCKVCDCRIQKEALLECHLTSELHCKKFCLLVNRKFNIFISKERITTVELDVNELASRMKELPAFAKDSSVIGNIYDNFEAERLVRTEMTLFAGSSLGFSPSAIEREYSVVDEDLLQVSHCALCNESPARMVAHLSSNTHQLRLMIFNRCNSVEPMSVFDYLHTHCSSSSKTSLQVEKYKKYKLLLRKQGLDFGIPFKSEYLDLILDHNEPHGKSSCERADDITEARVAQKETISSEISFQPVRAKINAEKMSLECFLMVEKCLKQYVNNIVPAKNGFFCLDCICHITPEEAEKHMYEKGHLAKIPGKNRILQHHQDPNFINFVEKWSFENKSCFVCICCAITIKNPKSIFRHLKNDSHIHLYEKVKEGSLKPISPLQYEFNPENGLYICKKCKSGLFEVKNLTVLREIRLVATAIKVHESDCSGIVTSFEESGIGTSNLKTMSKELYRKLSTDEESDDVGDEIESATASVAQLKITYKTDGRKGVKSPVKVESHAGMTVEDSKKKPVCMDKENSAPASKDSSETIRNTIENNSTEKPKKNRNSEKKSPQLNPTPLIHRLDSFRKRCPIELTEYLCAICLVSENMRAAENHMKSEKHMLNENYVAMRWKLNISLCTFCKILLLGTTDMFRQHYNSTYHVEKEAEATGKPITVEPLQPKKVKMLEIRGMPNIEKNKQSTFINHLLQPFGKISRLTVKKGLIKVQFADQKALSEAMKLNGIRISEKKSLDFSIKTVALEFEIGIESNAICILSDDDKVQKVVSMLVKQADDKMSSEVEKSREEQLCNALQKVVECVYPNCKCFKFGSRVTGLTVGECDLDVFLDYDNAYNGGNEDLKVQGKIVRKVGAALKASQQFSDIIAITHCRVPIVTCLHKQSNIHCDISFKNGLSCENTNLVKFMISLDDRIKGVVLFLKNWTKFNSLHGRPFFSSYAVTMLVFFYLQQGPEPVLPTIEFLKSCYEGEKVIGEWDCGFTTNPDHVPKTKNSKSVLQLIHGFFNFCATFDFKGGVVSPLTGNPLPRNFFEDAVNEDLPEPYYKYQSEINPANFSEKEAICLMDPFDLNHNLTKSFPCDVFKKFLYLCRICANLLSHSLNLQYYAN